MSPRMLRRLLCGLLVAGGTLLVGRPMSRGDEARGSVAAAVTPEPAPTPTPRSAPEPAARELTRKIVDYFDRNGGRRIYIQIDKPLYHPGETIWLKTWDLTARKLAASKQQREDIKYTLVDPKGMAVSDRWYRESGGTTTGDIPIPPSAAGGEYRLRVATRSRVVEERSIVVQSYEPPRIKKELELGRKAYGPGDEVTANLTVKRATGEALANQAATVVVELDGRALPRTTVTTNAHGAAVVRFVLPRTITVGDGLLTVLVSDGGITESLSKRIPILVNRVDLKLLPEGGSLVAGLPSRVYFEAQTPLGKPADVAGRIVDDRGQTVTTFESYKNGLGRFSMTPAPGRAYFAEITRPAPAGRHRLPRVKPSGCTLRSFDDLDGQLAALRVSVRCTQPQRVIVVGTVRENVIDNAAVMVPAGQPAIVYLTAKEAIQGVARVTVFGAAHEPLAERLVYRHRRARLGVNVKADRQAYAPRDRVTLTVTTTNDHGAPAPAELALSVVDDTVVSFADDKAGHLLSRLLLEPDVPGKVDEPNAYFDLGDPRSALAMDLLMGARGWRTFEWREILSGKAPRVPAATELSRARLDLPPPPPERPQRAVPPATPVRGRVMISKSHIIILDKIYFRKSGATIRRIQTPILDAMIATLRGNPQLSRVEIQGHTDPREEAEHPGLAAARARVVVDYLVKGGVAAERLVAAPYGASRPVAPNRTLEGREKTDASNSSSSSATMASGPPSGSSRHPTTA